MKKIICLALCLMMIVGGTASVFACPNVPSHPVSQFCKTSGLNGLPTSSSTCYEHSSCSRVIYYGPLLIGCWECSPSGLAWIGSHPCALEHTGPMSVEMICSYW